MAAINQELNFIAKTESLDRAINSLGGMTAATDKQISAADRLFAAQDRLDGLFSQSDSQISKISAEMSAATARLVDQLTPYQDAISSAFTDAQKKNAIDQLLKQMDRVGLAFTSAEAEAIRAELVIRDSLEEMARGGEIAANSLAELKFADQMAREEERAATAAEREADRIFRATERAVQQRIKEEERAAATVAREEARAAKIATQEAEKAAKAQEKLAKSTKKTESFAKRAAKGFMNFGKASNPVDKLSNRLARTVVTLFSVRRVLRYITDAMERAPDKISSSFSALGDGMKDTFGRVIVSLMGGMQGGVDKLNKAMNSKAGQTLFRGLERAATLAGNAIGKLMEGAAWLVEFLGNHAQEVFTIAAIAAGFFAAQMLVSAAASAAAAWPLLLIVGLATLLVVGLKKLGVTAADVFEVIGQGAGWLYALVYNIVADIYNLFATFAEFFANVFNDPVAAVAHLFFDTFDDILSMVETVAKAIDMLPFVNGAADAVSGFRSNLKSWVNDTFGENEIQLERMEKIGYFDTANAWGEKARGIGEGIDNFLSGFSLGSLGQQTAPQLKSIKSDTSSIKKAVNMTKEDIKSLVDIAERRFVNNVNLTTQRPVITINGANTGNTERDRQALADQILEVLIEQTASGATVATAMP